MTGAKPSFNVHEENGKSALEPNIDQSFPGKWKIYLHSYFTFVWPTEIDFAAIYSSLWTQPQGCPAMSKNVTQKLIESHRVEGRMKPGEEIDLWRTST